MRPQEICRSHHSVRLMAQMAGAKMAYMVWRTMMDDQRLYGTGVMLFGIIITKHIYPQISMFKTSVSLSQGM